MKKISIFLPRQELSSDRLASKLHGFLMELLPSDYAAYLHGLETNPYATVLRRTRDHHIWQVTLLTAEAVEQMGQVLLSLEWIDLREGTRRIPVEKVEVTSRSESDLLEIFQGDCQERQFTLHFVTPTSFKSKGDYLLFPSPRFIYQSLMQKYTRLTGGDEIDHELLDYLEQQTRLTAYELKSHYFTVHKQKIPAFVGQVRLTIGGAETLRAYVKMLLTFGEYSGIGIKSSLGMGGMQFESRKK